MYNINLTLNLIINFKITFSFSYIRIKELIIIKIVNISEIQKFVKYYVRRLFKTYVIREKRKILGNYVNR